MELLSDYVKFYEIFWQFTLLFLWIWKLRLLFLINELGYENNRLLFDFRKKLE